MKEEQIRVLLVEKDGLKTTIRETSMKNELEELQKYVGGYIEVTSAIPDGKNPGRPLHFVIHDEGKFQEEFTPIIGFASGNELIDYIVGKAVVVTSNEEGDFCSLSDDDIDYFKSRYGKHGTMQWKEEPHHILVFSG